MTFKIKSFGDEEKIETPKKSYTIKSFEEEPPSIGEQLKTAPGFFGRETAAQTKGLPRTFGEILRSGSKKLQEMGEAQALEQDREIPEGGDPITNAIVNILGKPAEYFEKLGLPTSDEARKALTEVIKERYGTELPQQGRGGIERFAQGAGAAVPFAAGASSVGAAGIVGAGGISQAAELGPGAEAATNIGLPVALELARLIAQRRYTPQAGEAEQIYNTLRQMGMSDEQLSPILATEGQISRYGPLAAGRRQTRQAFQNAYESLGETVERMQNAPGNLNPVSPQQQNRFVNALQNIENDIRTRTPSLSPQELTHANFIRDAILDIQQNGLTPRRAIGLWRSNNRIGLGQTELSRLRAPVTQLLEDVNPQLAREFRDTNRAYQRYFANIREINPRAFTDFINAGEMQRLLGAIFTGDAATLGKAILNRASLGAARRLSSAMITNPHFQSFGRKFRVAINSGSEAAQRNLYRQFQEAVKKEYPEEYKEINWPKTSQKQQ